MSNSRSHPLRRISTGSLSNLARSQEGHPTSHTSPSGLEFLTGPMFDLSDEAAALASHVQAMNRLHDSLGTFNEAFAGYLYALRMNAFCVEWTEAPDDRSWARAKELAPLPTAPSVPLPPSPSQQDPTSTQSHHPPEQIQPGDQTYATANDFNTNYNGHNDNNDYEYQSPPRSRLPVGRGSGIPRGTGMRGRGGTVRGRVVSAPAGARAGAGAAGVTERKKREAAITAIIDTLPIEFRGGDPATRQSMEKVLTQLIQNPEGRKIGEIVGATDLPQPKVNKCLIALVGRKAVGKSMVGGVTVYRMN